mgnify:CR=1 FL=1
MLLTMYIMESLSDNDYLTVDTPLPGQNYACMSFVSPENILADKNVYYIQSFLKSFVNKLNLDNNLNLDYKSVKNEYENYMVEHKDKIDKDFNEEHSNQTSVRGIKIRGVYDSYQEAEARSKLLQKLDSTHNIFIGQVGYWLPWDPDPNKLNSEYQEEELNNLMKEYNKNQQDKDIFYQEQTKERVQKAKDQNDTDFSTFGGIFDNDNIQTSSETNADEKSVDENNVEEVVSSSQ